MRSLFFAALLSWATFAQTPTFNFRTGQAARALIGQPTFTAQSPGVPVTVTVAATPTSPASTRIEFVPTERILGAASGLAIANDMMFVADASRVGAQPDNHRVLIYRNLNQQVPALTAEIGPSTGRCPICVGAADVALGQRDFRSNSPALTASGLRSPTSVHSDGVRLVVADTDNNRVLIWNTIPTTNGQPANVVLGQENFTSLKRVTTDNRSFRGPQGVWIQDGRLFVADTQNHRILIWNQIPTANHAAADLVIGQADFTSAPEQITNITQIIANRPAARERLLNPVSVTSDGRRLFVSDLGHNRVVIWNSIPTRNGQPADVVIGQPDFESRDANNVTKLCASTGKDTNGKDLFPRRCGKTLDFPRFALSDGTRLFISDGGNDRILIYNSIPTQNAPAADIILGQLSETLNLTTDNPAGPEAFPNRAAASDIVRTPGALALHNGNLYVADPYNRRVLIYSPADPKILPTGVRNAASREVFSVAAVTFAGTLKENDEVTVKIGDREYKYKVTKANADNKDFGAVLRGLFTAINSANNNQGDPQALATINPSFLTLILTARVAGQDGDSIALETKVSDGATITATGSGATFRGGQDAAAIAPGTIVSIFGENLSEVFASAPVENFQLPLAPGANPRLPLELAGVQVYFDGIRAPILSVSPTEIRAQLPWEVVDTTSVTGWVRTVRRDGTVSVSTAVSVPVIQENPGIFAETGDGIVDPRPGFVYHTSSHASATVSVDGTAQADNTASIIINGRTYSYRVRTGDVPAADRPASEGLQKIRDGLIDAINANGGDPEVVAFKAGAFTRIRLRSRVEGPAGNGIPVRVETSNGAQVIMTAFNNETCCANRAGARVTEDNPALPGQTITVYATGLGLVIPTNSSSRNDKIETITGEGYVGPDENFPVEFVSSLAGGRTANVIFARLVPGSIGIYEVQLELNTDLPTNPLTQLTISQSFQTSNIVTFPIVKPSN